MIKTAVIMAAGLGSRLKERTSDKPKAFLELNGKTLIELSLEKLVRSGIKKVIIGTGYLSHFFEKLNYRGLIIKCVRNNIYATTNSFYTLYNMQDFINEDFILLESDLIYEERALDILVGNNMKNVILASDFTNSQDEVFIETDLNNNLVNMSKNRSLLTSIYGELVGISKISNKLFKELIDLGKNNPKVKELDYESALVEASKKIPIYIEKIHTLLWTEIDTEQHYKRARIIYQKIMEMEYD